MKMANGENPKHYGANKAPITRMEEAALARGIYEKATQYKAKWEAYNKASAAGDKTAKQPDRDLDLEPVVEVLEGKRTVHNHTHRADDIMTALRLSDEFHYHLVVQQGPNPAWWWTNSQTAHPGELYDRGFSGRKI